MLHVVSVIVAAIYVLPVLLVVFARSNQRKGPLDVALAIPAVVAVDLLTILLLSRVVRFDVAVLVSRPAWVVGWLAHRRFASGTRALPALGRRTLAILVASASGALALSLSLSRPYGIWDREWHVPLVTSMRGQVAPFENVFEPGHSLHYHFSGDALAAALQTLSLGVFHSSLALSLAHDLMFVLTAVSVALLLVHAGHRASTTILASVGAVLLNGPWTIVRTLAPLDSGHSLFNYLTISFRPHVALAGLLLTGILGGLFARIDAPEIPARRTVPSLVACSGLLAITDEASYPGIGLALAAAWLCTHGAIHPKRWVGLGVLVVVALELPLVNLLYSASLAPGGPVSKVTLVAARSPGFSVAPAPLDAPQGLASLLHDVAPTLLACVPLLALLVGRPSKRHLAMLASFAALTGSCLFLLTKLDVNQSALESHRFFTAPLLAAPLVITYRLVELRRGSFSMFVGLAAVSLSAVSTVLWMDRVGPRIAVKQMEPRSHDMSCRAELGTRLFERVRPTYAAPSILWAAAGCRPLYMPGIGGSWSVKVHGPRTGRSALEELDEWARGAPVRALCEVDDNDPVCRFAATHNLCTRAGARVVSCELDQAARREVLRAW